MAELSYKLNIGSALITVDNSTIDQNPRPCGHSLINVGSLAQTIPYRAIWEVWLLYVADDFSRYPLPTKLPMNTIQKGMSSAILVIFCSLEKPFYRQTLNPLM